MRLALVLALLLPGLAAASPAQLKAARDTFEYGSYEEAARLSEALLGSHQLAEERDLVDAYRIAGLSNFYLNRQEAARRDFVGLLSVDPDFTMDPFLVPPAAVAFFDGVKRDNESLLGPIRERRKALAEQERLAEEARRRLLEENRMRASEPDRPVLVQRVEKRTFLVNLLPLGAGQFQEDRPVVGAIFGTAQASALVVSAASYLYIESLRDPVSGRFSSTNYPIAYRVQYAKYGGFALAGALYVAGVVDSLLHYEASVSRIEALPQPPRRPAPAGAKPAETPAETPPTEPSAPQPEPPSPKPVTPAQPAPATPSALLAPWVGPDGGGLALSLRF